MVLCLGNDCAALSRFPSGLSLLERVLDLVSPSIELVFKCDKMSTCYYSCTGVYVILLFKYGNLNHVGAGLGLREPLYVHEILEFVRWGILHVESDCGGEYGS